MRKLLLLLVLFTAPFSLIGQTSQLPVDPETKLVTYTEVVNMPGVNQKELYKRAHKWFHKYYKNPADVIREKDSVSATITGIHRFKITKDVKGTKSDAGMVQYTIKVMCKEGKYKYEVSKINWKQTSYYGIEKWMDKTAASYDPQFESYLAQTDQQIKAVIEDLKKGMNDAGEKKKEDW